jgi:hypothetical protein
MARRLLFIAGCLHLLLVAYGATGVVPLAETHLAGRVIEAYRAYSGADNRYGFFAPSVAAARRVKVHVFSENRWTEMEEPLTSLESKLRASSIAGLFAQPQLTQGLAASYAALAFGRFPRAEVVLIEQQFYRLPPQEAYRRGERPRWTTEGLQTFTQASIARGGRP